MNQLPTQTLTDWHRLHWRSLKTRVTLGTLAIFVIGSWLIALLTSQVLRRDLERLLGEQQASVAAMVAGELDHELRERLSWLADARTELAPLAASAAPALQSYLQRRISIDQLFNMGVFITDRDGTVIASVPTSIQRLGVNYGDRGAVAAALKEGRTSIGPPVLGRVSKTPVIGIATPIRNARGQVLGALVGGIDVGSSDFLKVITKNHYGDSGSYQVIDVGHRLTVASSDKDQVLSRLPPTGTLPAFDRLLLGQAKVAVYVDKLGVERLESLHRITAADWAVVISAPTHEVFAPINSTLHRVLAGAAAMSLLAAGLTWLLLKRQLEPLQSSARALAARSGESEPAQALPIVRNDEVGQLIASLNALLERQGLQARRAQALLALPLAADSLSESAFMQHALELAGQLSGSAVAVLHLVNEDQQTIKLVACAGDALAHDGTAGLEGQFPLSQAGSWADALHTRAPVMVNDYDSSAAKRGLPAGHARLQRFISVPVIQGGLVRMLCGVGNKPERYTKLDLETVRLIAESLWHIVRQQRSDNAMRESQKSLREAQHIAGVGSYVLEIATGNWESSDELDKLFGIDAGYQRSVAGWENLVAAPDQAMMSDYLRNVVLGQGQSFNKEYRITRQQDRAQRWVSGLGQLEFDAQGQARRMHGTIQDITERKLVELHLQRLSQLHQALIRSNEAIARCHSDAELLPQICRSLVESGAVRMAWIGLHDQAAQAIVPVASFGDQDGYLARLHIGLEPGDPSGQGPTGTAFREQRAVWCQNFASDPHTVLWQAQAGKCAWAASAALPLQRQGQIVGIFNVYADTVSAFDPETQALLSEMAADISFALDGYEREAGRQRAQAALRTSEQRQRSITESAADAIISCDNVGNIVGWNHAAQTIFGYSETEAMGQPMTLIMPARYHQRLLAGMNRLRVEGELDLLGTTVELDGQRRNGEEFPLELTLARWESDGCWFVSGIVRDITRRKAQLAQIHLSAQVFSQGREGIALTDLQGTIVMVNPAFTEITGYSAQEAVGRNPRILKSERQPADFYAAMWAQLLATGNWSGEIWNRHKSGTIYPEWLSISALRDEHGVTSHYMASFSDLSIAKEAENRIQWLSHFDTLTGLPNRTLLRDRAAQALSMVQRNSEPLAMLLVAIDHFTTLTDTLGQPTGDALLIEMAQRLRRCVRDQDTVARLTGKEFVLMLPGTSARGAAHLAGELLAKLAQPYPHDDGDLTLSCSIGIASYPANASDFDALLKAAQVAMHRAQNTERGTYQFYSDDIYQQVLARDQMVKALRHAAELDQLALMYQPQVDLQSGRICGLEALLRWTHPELGAVSPAQFIPLAEEAGLIVGIGQWVLRRACRDIRVWLDQGIAVPHVAVNVSPLQFYGNDLVTQVKDALSEWQVDPALIYIEVTETSLMSDVARSEALLMELKELGLKLSLDDFGTGYSSLSYLKRFPFDQVKIDQSFVRDLSTSQSDNMLTRVIIVMAHVFGMKVIAEGVETEAQCEILHTSNCDEIQGYLFSRPVSAPDIAALFVEGRQLPGHLLRLPPP